MEARLGRKVLNSMQYPESSLSYYIYLSTVMLGSYGSP